MKYYKVNYQPGKNNEHIYPPAVRGVVWNLTQYHYKEKVMIGGTEDAVKADEKTVFKLTKKAAIPLIEEYKKSYPKPKKGDMALLPGE